ncbi:MAG: methyltransferase domain-containing protein [archaeon GB-1867-005]|nr:methyltransferase domain-containing protein [Candidatus Culexmicrobium cathedralense]
MTMFVSPYFKTPREVAREMLKLAKVKPNDIVYDLGAGDGEIVVTAAKEFGAKAIGVEIQEKLVNIAKRRIIREGLFERAKVILGNLFEVDLSNATVITLYLLRKANELLKRKFEEELKPGTRIVAHMIPIPGWEPTAIKTVYVENIPHIIYLYVMSKFNFNVSNVKHMIRKAVASLRPDDAQIEELIVKY